MHRRVFLVKGMHCRSCEILLGGELKKMRGVEKVNVNFKTGRVEIFFADEIEQSRIANVVRAAGYSLSIGADGNDGKKKPWLSSDPKVYRTLAVSAIFLIILYFILRSLGLSSVNFGNGRPSSLLVVLTVGLTAGFSTCMALVGGLVLGFSARHTEKHPTATAAQKFRPHLFFNLGRIISYFILGGLIALIGEAFQLSGTVLGLITIAVGVVMLVLGVQLTELFPRLSGGVAVLPSSIGKALGMKGHETREYSHKNAIVGGALTFFLPCGFTQAMQLYAVTSGSFFSGALIMGIFALGTAPGLLGVGGLTSLVRGNAIKHFYRFAGALVFALAVVNMRNGLNLTGWGSISFPGNTESSVQTVAAPAKSSLENVELIGGVQVARMDQLANSYKPNSFVVKRSVPVKWIVTSKNPYSCAAALTMPAMGIQQYLEPGENIFEFTPQKTGNLNFSCSMGMYAGRFKVIE